MSIYGSFEGLTLNGSEILATTSRGCFFPRTAEGIGKRRGRVLSIVLMIGFIQNEEPRSKLLGIFVGEEIYYTGLVHTPIRKLDTTFSVVVNFPEQARTEGSTGYGPGLPIKRPRKNISVPFTKPP
jgi:hypothetical protein